MEIELTNAASNAFKVMTTDQTGNAAQDKVPWADLKNGTTWSSDGPIPNIRYVWYRLTHKEYRYQRAISNWFDTCITCCQHVLCACAVHWKCEVLLMARLDPLLQLYHALLPPWRRGLEVRCGYILLSYLKPLEHHAAIFTLKLWSTQAIHLIFSG